MVGFKAIPRQHSPRGRGWLVMAEGKPRFIVSRAQAKRLIHLVATRQLGPTKDGRSAVRAVAEMLMRSQNLADLPEHVGDVPAKRKPIGE